MKAVVSEVTLAPLNIATIEVPIEGTSPLIMHKWSEKAKTQMRDKQAKKAAKPREARDPTGDYLATIYFLDKIPKTVEQLERDPKKFPIGFPSIAFKAAVVDAATQVTGITKTFLRGAFHIDGELVAISGAPRIREDMVRNQTGVADIRYRAEFPVWGAVIPVRYAQDVITPDQIVNLFNRAGFSVGVGDWRPQKDGQNGMWMVRASS